MISIIVPVYNLGNYLQGCLESILRSSYKDIEIILVDDGSTDGSNDVCDSYALKDNRIRVVHKENSGVSTTRNRGLEEAKGEYIMFVDGDDQIHPNMIEWLLDAIQSGDYDFAMAYGVKMKGTLQEIEGSIENNDLPIPSKKDISQSQYMQKMYDSLDFQYHVIWNKLYRRTLVEGLFFRETKAEDVDWLNRMALRMRSAVVLDAELYYYIQRMDSLVHNWNSSENLDRINTYLLCLSDIPKEKGAYRAMCLKTMYSVMLSFRRHFRNTPLEKEANERCKTVFKETIGEFLHSEIGMMSKMRSVIGYHMPRLYDYLLTRIEAKQSKRA
jgi:glycosyltransferase involved in cell wall biosynthesis